MNPLPEKSDLKSLQQYLAQLCTNNGWDKNSVEQTFLLFTEEVGEMAKAIRYHKKLYVEQGKQHQHDVGSEMADVLSYLLQLANQLGIDLDDAFRKKEAQNAQRTWK